MSDNLEITKSEFIDILKNRGKHVSSEIDDDTLLKKVKYLKKQNLVHLATIRELVFNESSLNNILYVLFENLHKMKQIKLNGDLHIHFHKNNQINLLDDLHKHYHKKKQNKLIVDLHKYHHKQNSKKIKEEIYRNLQKRKNIQIVRNLKRLKRY